MMPKGMRFRLSRTKQFIKLFKLLKMIKSQLKIFINTIPKLILKMLLAMYALPLYASPPYLLN